MVDVHKTYKNGVVALTGIDLKIEQGEFVYIVGQSGAGKSTFIKMIYCAEKPSKGTVVVNNINLSTLKKRKIPHLRRSMGIVFQDFKLLPRLTVYENVAFALEVLGEPKRSIRKRVMHVLDLVKLKHKARSWPDELSGGEQQRLSIARALANRPKILIADEPTGNLDHETSMEIMDILQSINSQGTTVVMATHNRDIVNNLRRRVIAIDNGRIVRDEMGGSYDHAH